MDSCTLIRRFRLLPSEAASSGDFLLLPAYDLEIAPIQGKTPELPKVGDSLVLKASGLSESEVSFHTHDGDDLEEQGWELNESSVNTPQLSVTPVKSGKITLPSLIIQDKAGKAIGRTNPFSIEVASAIKKDDPKPDQPADIAPPVSLNFPWALIVIISLFVLLLGGGLGYLGWKYFKNRKPAVEKKPAEPPRPEDEVALTALLELERLGLYMKGQYKKHYFGVSEILKAYLGARYRFDALESTTQELVGFLEERKTVSDTIVDKIETLFGTKLDRVKFTDHVPAEDESKQIVADARELVMSTRRIPQILPSGKIEGSSNAVR